MVNYMTDWSIHWLIFHSVNCDHVFRPVDRHLRTGRFRSIDRVAIYWHQNITRPVGLPIKRCLGCHSQAIQNYSRRCRLTAWHGPTALRGCPMARRWCESAVTGSMPMARKSRDICAILAVKPTGWKRNMPRAAHLPSMARATLLRPKR